MALEIQRYESKLYKGNKNQPLVHLLIVGVGAYSGLGMKPISASVPSAFKLMKWLFDNEEDLPVEIGTVAIALKPINEDSQHSTLERQSLDKFFSDHLFVPDDHEEPTISQLHRIASQWRKDCAANPESIAICYLVGHGVYTEREHFFFCDDFVTDSNSDRNCFRLEELVIAMEPSELYPDMARKQLFLYDACSEVPKTPQKSPTRLLEIPDKRNKRELKRTTLHAAAPGKKAYHFSLTVFMDAFIWAIDGGAASNAAAPDTDDAGFARNYYYVHTKNLKGWMDRRIDCYHALEYSKEQLMQEGEDSQGGFVLRKFKVHDRKLSILITAKRRRDEEKKDITERTDLRAELEQDGAFYEHSPKLWTDSPIAFGSAHPDHTYQVVGRHEQYQEFSLRHQTVFRPFHNIHRAYYSWLRETGNQDRPIEIYFHPVSKSLAT